MEGLAYVLSPQRRRRSVTPDLPIPTDNGQAREVAAALLSQIARKAVLRSEKVDRRCRIRGVTRQPVGRPLGLDTDDQLRVKRRCSSQIPAATAATPGTANVSP